jgi:hypothetical protein
MGKKQKRGKILDFKPVYPPGVVESIGIVSVNRKEALISEIDTAIWLWFLEHDALSIHLLIMTAHNCLHELEFTPLPPNEIDLPKLYTAYNFLRHSTGSSKRAWIMCPR